MTDISDARRDEIIEFISYFLDKFEMRCLCGERMESKNIQVLERDNWVYHHCPGCLYDYNHEKIARIGTKLEGDQLRILMRRGSDK